MDFTFQELSDWHDELEAVRALQFSCPESNVELCAIHELEKKIEVAERELKTG